MTMWTKLVDGNHQFLSKVLFQNDMSFQEEVFFIRIPFPCTVLVLVANLSIFGET